jgi:hypothetical protein
MDQAVTYHYNRVDKFSVLMATKTGTDVEICEIFSPNKIAKKWRFLLETKLNYAKF